MKVSCSTFADSVSQIGESQSSLPCESLDCHGLQLYDNILSRVLQDLGKSVRDVPKPRIIWEEEQ